MSFRNLSLLIQAASNRQRISLTKLEYQLLELLFSDPVKVFSYREIRLVEFFIEKASYSFKL